MIVQFDQNPNYTIWRPADECLQEKELSSAFTYPRAQARLLFSDAMEQCGKHLSANAKSATNYFLMATSDLPKPDLWWDDEGFLVIEWDRGPNKIFTLKIRGINGRSYWANKVGNVQKCGKFDVTATIGEVVIQAVKQVV